MKDKSFRLNVRQLDDVCADCTEFITKDGLVDCRECAIKILKDMQRKNKTKESGK